MISSRCERARHWVSLDLDDALSPFESAFLSLHLRSCEECRVFAADTARHTRMLREAPFESLPRPVELPVGRSSRAPARMVGGGLVAAAAAAAILLGPQAPTTSHGTAARAQTGLLFVVVPRSLRPGQQDLTVPRLKAQPANADDGAVHGYLSTPA